MTEEIDLKDDAVQTPDQTESRIAGLESDWTTGEDWEGVDYASVPVPDEERRPKWEWGMEERRAFLLKQLRRYGHSDNIPATQRDLADDFGVVPATINNDFKRLREYIRFHAGNRAISDTEVVAQKAVSELLEKGKPYKALRAQLEYDEWLFELGRLDRAPEKVRRESVNVNATPQDLAESEAEHFENLAEQLEKAQQVDSTVVEDGDGDDEDVIDVENTEE